jgi:hypothetical protein
VGDRERDVLWVASAGRKDVSRIDVNTGDIRTYNLPVYKTTNYSCPVPEQFDCTQPVESPSTVGDMAIAANGDLWFTDTGWGRIGVITGDKQ